MKNKQIDKDIIEAICTVINYKSTSSPIPLHEPYFVILIH